MGSAQLGDISTPWGADFLLAAIRWGLVWFGGSRMFSSNELALWHRELKGYSQPGPSPFQASLFRMEATQLLEFKKYQLSENL